jgi:hypothetical protein
MTDKLIEEAMSNERQRLARELSPLLTGAEAIIALDFTMEQTLALTAERDELTRKNAVLMATLQACRDKWDTAGNGRCGVYRSGYRMSDLKGNVQRCENPACLSHQIRSAIKECK